MWVIQRDDGKYVRAENHDETYTDRLELAKTYATRERAEEAGACAENERIVSVFQLMQRPS